MRTYEVWGFVSGGVFVVVGFATLWYVARKFS